jgi:hypothetical protein
MARAMTITGLVIAALLAVLFAADLALGLPFGKASMTMDVGFLVCSLILGYLSWSALRERV